MKDYYLEYETKYYNDVIEACNCIELNSCKILQNEVDNIKETINKLSIEDNWQDSVGDVFDEIKVTCVNSLEKISNSIATDFQTSETLYKKMKELLIKLQEKNLEYQTRFKEQPNYNEKKYYDLKKYYKIDGTFETKNEFNPDRYNREYELWRNDIRILENDCEKVQLEIDSTKNKLDDINELTIENKNLVSLPTFNKKYSNLLASISLNDLLDNYNLTLESSTISTSITTQKTQLVSEKPIEFSTSIPSDIKQAGYTVTGYDKWIKSGNEMHWHEGTNQNQVAKLWEEQGSKFKNGIAIINDNGQDKYLIATSDIYGKVGDSVTVNFADGTSIECIIADQKSTKDSNYSKYGHKYGSKTNILEFEVSRDTYTEIGTNPETNSWGLDWDSSSDVTRIDNRGSIINS